MPFTQPSRSDGHVNRPLTNISLAFLQNADNFVAAKVFPTIGVAKQSDAYFTYDRGAFNRDDMKARTPGSESAGANYSRSTDTYYAETRALHFDIDDQVRANADAPINIDREATEFLTRKALINREIKWASTYFTAGAPGDTWTLDVDGAAARSAAFDPTSAANNDVIFWDDASSTPIEDIRLLKREILGSTGFMPNLLTLGRSVFDALVDHPDIVGRLDRGQTTGPAQATKDSLAALFEVGEIAVMDAIQNTAAEGATNAHSLIGGKHALLSYRPANPGPMTPAAGYTFNWSGLVGSGNEGIRIKRFRMEHLAGDRVEIDMSYDHKLISPDMGVLFGDIVQ